MLTALLLCYAQFMALSDQQLLHYFSRMPFVDSAELAGILGEPHATVHRALADLLADGIAGRVTPRHRPPAVESEILRDGHRHQTGRRDARFCHGLGLRASLPRVQ